MRCCRFPTRLPICLTERSPDVSPSMDRTMGFEFEETRRAVKVNSLAFPPDRSKRRCRYLWRTTQVDGQSTSLPFAASLTVARWLEICRWTHARPVAVSTCRAIFRRDMSTSDKYSRARRVVISRSWRSERFAGHWRERYPRSQRSQGTFRRGLGSNFRQRHSGTHPSESFLNGPVSGVNVV